MALNISTLQLATFQGTGEIVISGDNNRAGGSASIKSAGILHKIKTFFGFSSAKAANAETIDAIRTAIRNDRRLFMASGKADQLLGAVRGTITADKVRSILDELKSEVNGLKTKNDFQNAAKLGLEGRLAAQKTPGFIKKLGLQNSAMFMGWYKNVVTATAVKTAQSQMLGETGIRHEQLKTELQSLRGEKGALEIKLAKETDPAKQTELRGKIAEKDNELNGKKTAMAALEREIAPKLNAGLESKVLQESIDATNNLLKQCFGIIGKDKNHLKTFVSMLCSPGAGILGSGTDVTADAEKTLNKVREAKAMYEKADAFGSSYGMITKVSIFKTLTSMAKTYPADFLENLVKTGRSIDKTDLQYLGRWSDKEQIAKAIKNFREKAEKTINGFLNEVFKDSGKMETAVLLPLQAIALQSAIASLPDDVQQGIFDALESKDGKELRQEWQTNLDGNIGIVTMIADPLQMASGKEFQSL